METNVYLELFPPKGEEKSDGSDTEIDENYVQGANSNVPITIDSEGECDLEIRSINEECNKWILQPLPQVISPGKIDTDKCRVSLQSLLDHPLNKEIQFRGKAFVHVAEKKRMTWLKGLKPSLQLVFWPDYQYSTPRYGTGTGATSLFDGLTRGEYVHEQLKDYINLPSKLFSENHRDIHLYTKKAIIAMRRWNLTPCKAEFNICDLDTKVATRPDALVMTDNSEFGLIDWKCGMDDYMLKGNAMLKGPFKTPQSNCPLHQACLQVLFEKIFLEKNYGFTVKNLWVVQIRMDGIIPYAVPQEFVDSADRLYAYFLSKLDEAKEKKRKSIIIERVKNKRGKKRN